MNDINKSKTYGYEILVATFEVSFRQYLSAEIEIINGKKWKDVIPQGIFTELKEYYEKEIKDDIAIEDFFDELNFSHLKEISVFRNNYSFLTSFFGDLSKERFTFLMIELNSYRRQIAHARSSFSEYDLDIIIDYIKEICNGIESIDIANYINKKGYLNANPIPESFFQEYLTQNNLPSENYDLDGGFVGREKEIKELQKLILSKQDRIITIIGAGGLGKTAVALKLAYRFLTNPDNPFQIIIWLSAKKDKLTDDGIVKIIPDIDDSHSLVKEILKLVDYSAYETLNRGNVPVESFQEYLFNIFNKLECLLIIDNLETILNDPGIIDFLREFPRPSQILITSRKGLGEIERRYPLQDMAEKDAIRLFRLVSRKRGRIDLSKLSDDIIAGLVKRVRCYPLLVKWSIGQVCLGKSVDSAFSTIFTGESEIAKFAFNDVFLMISENSKKIVYSMVIIGDESISKPILIHLSNLNEDKFDDSIKELIITSFVYPITQQTVSGITTEYSMLQLTRGFITTKLDEEPNLKDSLIFRYDQLSRQVQAFEAAKKSYIQSFYSLGIQSDEEKLAHTYINSAKNYIGSDDFLNASINFEKAYQIAPDSPHVLTEYAKFAEKQRHFQKALELAKKAVEIRPDYFYSWLIYGVLLRKQGLHEDALRCLTKSKELNQEYLPVYTELGKIYSSMGNYEMADIEFQKSLIEEKIPNYRHQMIVYQSMADNYQKWAEAFYSRKDPNCQQEKLNLAIDAIEKALKIVPDDIKLWKKQRKILIDYGKNLCEVGDYRTGKLYFQKCLSPVIFQQKTIIKPNIYDLSNAYFYLVQYGIKSNYSNIDELHNWFEIGNSLAKRDKYLYGKYKKLKNLLEGYEIQLKSKLRKTGYIKYYNMKKKYGIIKSDKTTYLFFLNSFSDPISSYNTKMMVGEMVSFIPKESENKIIASEINIINKL